MKFKTVSIGFLRGDGDIQVLATLNNNDELMSQWQFDELIDSTVYYFNENLAKNLAGNLAKNVIIFWRQDAPDYVTPCVPPEEMT